MLRQPDRPYRKLFPPPFSSLPCTLFHGTPIRSLIYGTPDTFLAEHAGNVPACFELWFIAVLKPDLLTLVVEEGLQVHLQ